MLALLSAFLTPPIVNSLIDISNNIIGAGISIMSLCNKCGQKPEYHSCSQCNQHLCISCFNNVHFGINSPRASKSIIYNRCIFCGEIYGINAKIDACDKCTVILSWSSGMSYLAAVNRVSELIRKNLLNPKLKDESYCKEKFGTHATQVIIEALESNTVQM
ncbi:MAG TPA: hypothetical protein VF220_03490 [Nitrososphaeraceae archaeon]